MTSALVAAVVLALGLAGAAGCHALIALTPAERVPAGLRVWDVARFYPWHASLTLVGVLIVWRRPGNRVGWFLSAAALASAAQLLAGGYTIHGIVGDRPLPSADIAGWLFAWLGVPPGFLLGLVALSFPDGRFPSRRAKLGVVLTLVGAVLLVLVAALQPGPLLNMPIVDNPFAVPRFAAWHDPLIALGAAAYVGVFALCLSVLWGRLSRSTGEERVQFKWVVAAAGLTLALAAVGVPLIFVDWEAAKNVIAPGLSLIPLSIGVAILRHRLYDIDVLINRTIVYGSVSALLIAIYAGAVLLLQTSLRPFTSGSELAVAGSTLAVVALFQPLRRRVQNVVDRRFYRSRYDAARTVEALGARLRDEVDLDSVRADLLEAVRDTLQPSHASVWLRHR